MKRVKLSHLENTEGAVGVQALAEQSHGLVVHVVTAEVQLHQGGVLFQSLTQRLCFHLA